MEKIQELSLMDDEFMTKRLEDSKECVELVLHILIGRTGNKWNGGKCVANVFIIWDNKEIAQEVRKRVSKCFPKDQFIVGGESNNNLSITSDMHAPGFLGFDPDKIKDYMDRILFYRNEPNLAILYVKKAIEVITTQHREEWRLPELMQLKEKIQSEVNFTKKI